jgi:hypothetical protein
MSKIEKCPLGRWPIGADKKTACYQCVHSDKKNIKTNWGEHCNHKPQVKK